MWSDVASHKPLTSGAVVAAEVHEHETSSGEGFLPDFSWDWIWQETILQYAKQFAEKHGAKFNQGFLTDRWWTGMKRRHAQLRLRQSEGTAAARHKYMDPVKVAKYFSVVQQVNDGNKLPPESIWNIDETGMQFGAQARESCCP